MDKEEAAFPHFGLEKFNTEHYHYRLTDGLTKREWFAGRAKDDDIKEFRVPIFAETGAIIGYKHSRIEGRYKFADAMIAESKKGEG